MLQSPRTVLTTSPSVFVLTLGMLLTGTSVTAQVIRCVDPSNGQISYTDGACAKGPGTTLAPARSAAEVAQDDDRAQAARQRWQTEQLQQRQAGATAPAAPASSSAPSPGQRHNPACRAAQDELHALSRSNSSNTAAVDAAQRQMEMQCLSPEGHAALERSRANALAPGETTVVLPPHHARPPAHRPPPSKEPVQRLNCNVFRCFDQHGNAMPPPRPGGLQ